MAGPPPTVPQKVALARHAADLDDDGHTDIETLVTSETDTSLVPHPDGTGGVEWGAGGGGGSTFWGPILADDPALTALSTGTVWLPLATADGEPVFAEYDTP